MQRIIQILYATLPEGADVCAAAEFLISYITRETDSDLPLLLGQRVACRSELSLLEIFTTIRPASIQQLESPPSLAITAA